MVRFIIKRLLLMIPILLCITFLVSVFIELAPGDPVRLIAGAIALEEDVERIREELGLDKPLMVRYGEYIWNLVQGDFGNSYITRTPIWPDIMARFPYTLALATMSIILAALIGIPLGIYAATHQYSWKDNASIFGSLICVSMPSFWFALLLAQVFAVRFRILPVAGVQSWQGFILPVLSLALGYAAGLARQTRSNMLEVIRQDFITTARAKGQSERVIRYKHALKNACIPLVLVIGSMFGMALGGALIAEVVFSVPGLGQYTLTGLINRDHGVIRSSVLFLSIIFCFVMLLIDIAFAFVDPRIRSQFTKRRKTVKGD